MLDIIFWISISRDLLTELLQVSDEYDDLSDLKPSEMEQVKEWELQFRFQQIPITPLPITPLLILLLNLSNDNSPFSEKYELVGRLLKPGEEVNSFLYIF